MIFARRHLVLRVVLALALVVSAAAANAQAPENPSSTPPAAAAPPTSARPADPVESAGFGDAVTLTARPALVLEGSSPWDDLYGTFRKALEQINGIARAQGATINGVPMVRFVTSTDDTVAYEVILPVAAPTGAADRFHPAKVGATPAGSALRFVHFGAYDTIDQTYDEIANFLDERSIIAEDAFIEEYVRDPETTSEVDLATFIYVIPKATAPAPAPSPPAPTPANPAPTTPRP